MKSTEQNNPEEHQTTDRNFHSDSFRLKLGEVGEKSSSGNDQMKIKVDTDLYSHYIE